VCLTVHRLHKLGRWPTRCNSKPLLIFKLAQHISGNSLPILSSARLRFTACGMSPDSCRSEVRSAAVRTMCSVWRMLLEQHPSHRTLRASDGQLSGDITPHAVNLSLALLRMGKELPETSWANLKINKLLLLHLVGHLLYLYSQINTYEVGATVLRRVRGTAKCEY